MNAKLLLDFLGCRYTYYALMLLGAGLFVLFVVEDRALERVRDRYRPANCTITYSEVVEKVRHSRRSVHRSYHFSVKYHYEVNGKVYTSNRYRHGDVGSADEDDAFDAADRFPVGNARCFVDPESPDQAVLVQESETAHLYGIAFLGVLSLVSGVGGWAFLEFVVYREPAAKAAALSPSEPTKQAEVAPAERPLEIPAWSSLAKLGGSAIGQERQGR